MKRFWINSIPLLVVLLTLVFGFTMVADAGNCADLADLCDSSIKLAGKICAEFGAASIQCLNAQRTAGSVCYEYYNQCHS